MGCKVMSLSDDPVIQRFNIFLESGHDISDDVELSADAYTIHDVYYGKTLESLIGRYYVTMEEMVSQYADAISRHIKGKLMCNPNLICAIAVDRSLLGECLEDFESPNTNQSQIYGELCVAVGNGIINDIRSYYKYMIEHHKEEVISEGW
jgi:hypothetical protein